MLGEDNLFNKESNDEGVQFDFSNPEAPQEVQETPEVEPEVNNIPEAVEVTPEVDSSLKPETTEVPETPEVPQVVTPEITEEMLLKSLSERLDRDVSSFDDLKQTDPLAGDDYVKGLLEWRSKTGRPIEDYAKFQKDYNEVDDIQVAREFLQVKYPTLNSDEIKFELERNFISDEDDLDSEIKLKNLELKKFATEGRTKLNELKMDLGKPNSQAFTAEVQEQLDFASNIKGQIKANEDLQKEYTNAATVAIQSVDSITLPLGVDLSLDFKVETSKDVLTDMVMNATHWKAEDGSTDHNKVVRDAAILANFDKILALAYEQGKSSGTDEVIRDAKNTTLGDTVTGTAQPSGNKGPEIEGLDKYLGKQGMSIRRFR